MESNLCLSCDIRVIQLWDRGDHEDFSSSHAEAASETFHEAMSSKSKLEQTSSMSIFSKLVNRDKIPLISCESMRIPISHLAGP